MKKRAFTMVELIFVIVILGILAAVAVPKLNASRADAKTAALKANLVTLAKDFESYYAANGEFCSTDGCHAKLSDITSVQFDSLNPGFYEYGYFDVGEIKKCIAVAGRNKDKKHYWIVNVMSSACANALKDSYFDDIKWFFEGYLTYNTAPQPTGYGDARINQGADACHWMNDPSKGVNFE